MTARAGRNSPSLEWTRMTSRDNSPYFMPKPTPGYTSAYDTEKLRRNMPSVSIEKCVGRDDRTREHDRHAEKEERPSRTEYQYGMSKEDIEQKKQLEKKRKFLKERFEYVRAEGKMNKVVGACSMKRGTGRETPVFWQSKTTVAEDHASDDESQSPKKQVDHGFTISKAARFREVPVPLQENATVMIRSQIKPTTNTTPSMLLKHDHGTFGRSPSRPQIKGDQRELLSVNFEYTKGHLTRDVHLSRYAYRKPGEEEKPSSKFKQLFKQLQRPYMPMSERLRSTKGMSTMVSAHRGDLPSILRHADNDRYRAMSAMSVNETSQQIREILYSGDSAEAL